MLLTPEGKAEIIKIQKDMREKENGPKNEEESKAGCTANVCLITSEFIYVANAGNSDFMQGIHAVCYVMSKEMPDS